MAHTTLNRRSLEMVLSLILPAGCHLSVLSGATYRLHCPNFEVAHRVWENAQGCIYPLLEAGSVVEVVAVDYYARSHPKP